MGKRFEQIPHKRKYAGGQMNIKSVQPHHLSKYKLKLQCDFPTYPLESLKVKRLAMPVRMCSNWNFHKLLAVIYIVTTVCSVSES